MKPIHSHKTLVYTKHLFWEVLAVFARVNKTEAAHILVSKLAIATLNIRISENLLRFSEFPLNPRH